MSTRSMCITLRYLRLAAAVATMLAMASSGVVVVSAFAIRSSKNPTCQLTAATNMPTKPNSVYATITNGLVSPLQMKTSSKEELAATSKLSFPLKDRDGIYTIENAEQHQAFLEANTDKIVVLKFFARWCKACRALGPKYIRLTKDEKYANLPIVWCRMSTEKNQEYLSSLGVLALPSILIYSGTEGLVENFPCAPTKVPFLKKKIAGVIETRVDPETLTLRAKKDIIKVRETASGTSSSVLVSEELREHLRSGMPFFEDLSDDEFGELLRKAQMKKFEPGQVIMREGKLGLKKFYVIVSGEVEVLKKGDDSENTQRNYLGALVCRLSKHDFFGERALITNEVRTASIKATERTRCITWDKDDIPSSSVLNGKPAVAPVSDEIETTATSGDVQIDSSQDRDTIVSLLMRYKLLRYMSRCFDYLVSLQANISGEGEVRRRALIVDKLSHAQRLEFEEVFKLIDTDGNNSICIPELKRAMESVGEIKTDAELSDMMKKANSDVDGNAELSFDDFMGVMAEAELYNLLMETFKSLDKKDVGFVKASDLDKVLCGMRDLVTFDSKSIIDVEDADMAIDYSLFAKMLLGV